MSNHSALGHLSLHTEAVGKYWAQNGTCSAHWDKVYVYTSFIYK